MDHTSLSSHFQFLSDLIGVGLLLSFSDRNQNPSTYVLFSEYLIGKYSDVSVYLSIDQINSSYIYLYVWSWTINNAFSLELGYLIDPLTCIMSILRTMELWFCSYL